MKSGVANTDLNSPDKLELEVARILAKRKKRLGSSHSPSPAELRKLSEDSKKNNGNNENSKKLVTEATQTEPPTVTQEKVPSRAHVYGDYKFYDEHKERGFYDQTPSNRDNSEDSQNHRTSSRYRNSYDDSRMPRTASEHRNSYGEKHQNYTPPTIRRVASAHTSPWALKRDMFLDDDVPDFTSTSQPHKPKPTPYQSTTSFSDRYTHQMPHNSTNGSSPYKPLSDQITEQITKNMYYSDHTPLANYPTTAPSSPFFPSFNPANKQPHPPNPPAPTPIQNQQWQPEQLQQQLQQHQQQQQQQQPAQQTQPLQHTPSQQLQHTQSQHAQSQPLQHTQSQKSRYQQSQDNSEYFDASTPTIAVTPPIQQPVNPSLSPSRPLSPLISSYAVGDTDSVYSESEYEDDEYPEQEEPYELTTEDHMNVVLTGTELLMVMEKGMNKYHVSVNMPSMSKLVWSERGKIIGSQELKDVTDVSCMPHAIHPQLDNLQWHTAVSGGPLSKWGDSAWATLGFTLTVKKSIKGASRRKKIDFVCSTHEMQQSWVIGLNAIIQSKSNPQNGRRFAPMPFTMANGAGSNEVDKVVAYIDKVMGIDESVVDKVAQLVEQKRRVLHSTSPPRATVNKRSSLTIMPVAPAYLTSPAPSQSTAPSFSAPPPPSFPAPPTPTHAIPAPLAPASAPPAQIEPRATPTFTRSNTPTLPLVSRPPITRSNTSTGVLRVSPPGVKPRAPVARASSPLRRSVHL